MLHKFLLSLNLMMLLMTTSGGDFAAAQAPAQPNFVLIFFDDLGYGDFHCFNPDTVPTPNIDAVCKSGTRFTDFYVSQAVCTASRASLLSGSYANRVGLEGALNHTSRTGINPDEELLPELLQEAGYRTGMFGKWHLGNPDLFNPIDHGFQTWYGIPYSNDNTRYHPVLADEMPPLPMFEDRKVIEHDMDQRLFTKRLTERSVDFIAGTHDQPFFLYLPHVMPHVPIFASESFEGRSGRGLYADVLTELDWSVGQIMQALRDADCLDNTFIVITSDNGPFLSYGSHAGNNGGLREGKLTTFEGGVRVPMIASWPNHIPADSTCNDVISSMDLLPTFCKLASARLPSHAIDGIDRTGVFVGQSRQIEDREPLYFYSGNELQAVRSGHWKLHFAHEYLTVNGETRDDGKPASWGQLQPQSIEQSGVGGIASRHGYRVAQQALALYDLSTDPSESNNRAAEFPEIVEQLIKDSQSIRDELGDAITGQKGSAVRAVGRK